MSINWQCDKRYDWNAYLRIGLYYVQKKGGHYNVCDIHLGGVPGELFMQGIYSGPKDSSRDIRKLDRTADEIFRYDHGNGAGVSSLLEIQEGGRAQPVYDDKGKVRDIWLFGPLLFAGAPYGSLVVELVGLEMPTHKTEWHGIDKKTGKKLAKGDPQRMRYKIKFPKSYGLKYMPAKIWGSTYSGGRHPKGLKPVVDVLKNERPNVQPAILTSGMTRVEWRVEDFAGELTGCELYDRKG